MPADASDKGDASKTGAVRELLDTGFSAKGDAYSAAQAVWRSRRLASSRDARVQYAWGLVLRKQGKNRDAERQFRTAAGRNGPSYLPARQAVIWVKLARGQVSAALPSLESLIRAITSDKGVSDTERQASARWVGRLLAALEKQKLSKRDELRFKSIQKLVQRQFKDKLAQALTAGEADLAARIQELETADLKRDLIAKQKKAKRDKEKKKTLESRKETASRKQESIKRSAAQWKEWLEAREKAAKTTLTRQMKELRILEARWKSIITSMTLISQEWTTKNSQFQQAIQAAGRNERRRNLLINAGRQALATLEGEYFRYNQQRLLTFAAIFRARQAAAVTIRRFQADVKTYESATGQLSQQKTALAKWQGQLKQAEQRLKNQKLAGALASKAKGGKTYRITRLVEFDVDAERKRVLTSLVSSPSP